MSQGCLQLGCPRPSTSEALFIQNEGLHVVGELVLYMLITAVAIVGCRAAAKYLGQILGNQGGLEGSSQPGFTNGTWDPLLFLPCDFAEMFYFFAYSSEHSQFTGEI